MSAKSRRISPRPSERKRRSREVLFALVEEYIRHRRPLSSGAMQAAGFASLSSATIRNYFADLEEQGLLKQEHTSGGRRPTAAAYRLFADELRQHLTPAPTQPEELEELAGQELKGVATLLQDAVSWLVNKSQLAVVASSPRFDRDFVQGLRLVEVDAHRMLVVLLTEFGFVYSELIPVPAATKGNSTRRVERALQAQLYGQAAPEDLTQEERTLSQLLYTEAMMRQLARHSLFWEEELFRAGFARLLEHPEFAQPHLLGAGMGILEHQGQLRRWLQECREAGEMTCWIGEELNLDGIHSDELALLAMPYSIGAQSAGAIAVLGPMRLPYREVIRNLTDVCQAVSQALTRSLVKHKIVHHTPPCGTLHLPPPPKLLVGYVEEDKKRPRESKPIKKGAPDVRETKTP